MKPREQAARVARRDPVRLLLIAVLSAMSAGAAADPRVRPLHIACTDADGFTPAEATRSLDARNRELRACLLRERGGSAMTAKIYVGSGPIKKVILDGDDAAAGCVHPILERIAFPQGAKSARCTLAIAAR
jgi:hypothetical protein